MCVVETSILSVYSVYWWLMRKGQLLRRGVHRGRCIGEIPPNPVKPVVVCYVRIFVLKIKSIVFRTTVFKNTPDVREKKSYVFFFRKNLVFSYFIAQDVCFYPRCTEFSRQNVFFKLSLTIQ